MNASVNNVQRALLSTRPENCYPFFWCIKKKTVNECSLNIYVYLSGIFNFVKWSLIWHLCKHKNYLHPGLSEMFALLGSDAAMQCWLVVINWHWITPQKSEDLKKLLLHVLIL